MLPCYKNQTGLCYKVANWAAPRFMHPEWAGPGESGYQVANWAAPARWGPRVYERLDLGGVIHPQTRPSQFAGEEYTPHYAHPRARPAPSRSFSSAASPSHRRRRRWRARRWRRTWSSTAPTWRTTSRPTRSRRRRPGISICNRPGALSQSLLFPFLTSSLAGASVLVRFMRLRALLFCCPGAICWTSRRCSLRRRVPSSM